MNESAIKVPARYYVRLNEILAAQGIDIHPLLACAKISRQSLVKPDWLLLFKRVDRLVQAVMAVAPRSDVAFELGQRLTVGSHSFVGFGMLNCATLDEALRFEARYFRLVFPAFSMHYRSSNKAAEIHLSPATSMSHACLQFHLEAVAMAALREISDLTNNNPPHCRLSFSMPAPPHVQSYRQLRGVTACFDAEASRGLTLPFDNPLGGYRLSLASPNAKKVAEERCHAMIRQVSSERRFGEWVEMTLRESTEALPSLKQLAELLNISKRTLNRYLERDGISYRQLTGRVKHELACERLLNTGASVSEVAYSLGFTDVSNFCRAFRLRAGCSPAEYARSAQALKLQAG